MLQMGARRQNLDKRQLCSCPPSSSQNPHVEVTTSSYIRWGTQTPGHCDFCCTSSLSLHKEKGIPEDLPPSPSTFEFPFPCVSKATLWPQLSKFHKPYMESPLPRWMQWTHHATRYTGTKFHKSTSSLILVFTWFFPQCSYSKKNNAWASAYSW